MMQLWYVVVVAAWVALTASTPLSPEPEGGATVAPLLNGSVTDPDHSPDGVNGSVELRNETLVDGTNATVATIVLFGDDSTNATSAMESNGSAVVDSSSTHTAKSFDGHDLADDEDETVKVTDLTNEPEHDEKTTGAALDGTLTTEKSFAGLKDDDDKINMVTIPAILGALTPTPSRSMEPPSPTVLQLHPVPSGLNHTIQFRSGEATDWQSYVDDLATFLEPYRKEAQERNVHCDFEKELHADRACRFDLVYLGPSCTKQNNFGYGIGKPCVILSPAKIAGWVPAAYDNDTTEVPDEVQRLMRIFNANFLFVTCEGESEADRVNVGPMAYLPPYQGFPSYFFPYKGDTVPTYVAPLMAVEFLNPTNGTLINVACKAWAKNVNDVPLQATLRFSLKVN